MKTKAKVFMFILLLFWGIAFGLRAYAQNKYSKLIYPEQRCVAYAWQDPTYSTSKVYRCNDRSEIKYMITSSSMFGSTNSYFDTDGNKVESTSIDDLWNPAAQDEHFEKTCKDTLLLCQNKRVSRNSALVENKSTIDRVKELLRKYYTILSYKQTF